MRPQIYKYDQSSSPRSSSRYPLPRRAPEEKPTPLFANLTLSEMQFPAPDRYLVAPFLPEKRLHRLASTPNFSPSAFPPPGQVRYPYASPKRYKPLPPPLFIPPAPREELNALAVQMPDAPTPHPRLGAVNSETARRTRSHSTLRSEGQCQAPRYRPPAGKREEQVHLAVDTWAYVNPESTMPAEHPTLAHRREAVARDVQPARTHDWGVHERERYNSLLVSKMAKERIPLGSAADGSSRVKIRFNKITARDHNDEPGKALLATVRGVGIEEAPTKWIQLDDNNKQPLSGYRLDKGNVHIKIQWPGYKKEFIRPIDALGGTIRNVDLVREVAKVVQQWFDYVRSKGKKPDGIYPQWQIDYKNQGRGIHEKDVTLVGLQNIGGAFWQPMLDWSSS
ncbi:hypothetical protein EVG20_g9780 [Dentipellis fragilis]|uniref:Uncharacterized protein n=1 Tax=Dentipellis fragilis TaxID=205917 RepID=A0A4Y9XX46_9AGAM|nr:hypothetical protein EVG20_g9780 [Dentipellis fragilis]